MCFDFGIYNPSVKNDNLGSILVESRLTCNTELWVTKLVKDE